MNAQRYARHNEYADTIGRLFEETPKAVFAAIAVSALTGGGERLAQARAVILSEWRLLWQNGIVPQKPPGVAR